MTIPKLIAGDSIGNKIRMLESGATKAGGDGLRFMKIGAANAEITRLEGELNKANARIAELEAAPTNIKEIEASAQSLLNENKELRALVNKTYQGLKTPEAKASVPATTHQNLTGLARVTAAFQGQVDKQTTLAGHPWGRSLGK